MISAERPLSLLEFCTNVGNTLRTNPSLRRVWITAELSDVRSSGGHCYMELVEKSASGQTVAKMRANIWQSTYALLTSKFKTATGKGISSGMKVLLCGDVTHHTVYGLSLNVTDIDPTYTLGDLERLRREILQALEKEGIKDLNKSRRFPEAPQKIAVISAAGAAGYGDFINQLNSTPDHIKFYPHLFQAVMQGERTALSVMDALEAVEMTVDLWDCVVIIRGGGSTTDLNGFDNLELARRVATFPLPIVVGIGHERDRTVLDEIASVRCKTPTAVAGFLIDTVRGSYQRVHVMVDELVKYCRERVFGEKQRVVNYLALVPSMARQRLAETKTRLATLSGQLPMLVSTRIAGEQSRLEIQKKLVGTLALNRTDMALKGLDEMPKRLSESIQRIISEEVRKYESLKAMIDVLSPENTLKRGYSITRAGGKVVRNPDDVGEGKEIVTYLYSGAIRSRVEKCLQRNASDDNILPDNEG